MPSSLYSDERASIKSLATTASSVPGLKEMPLTSALLALSMAARG